MIKMRTILTALLLVAAVASCDGSREPETSPSPEPTAPVTEAEIVKYDAYAALVNAIADDLTRSSDAYVAEFGSGGTAYIISGFSGCELPETGLLAALDNAESYAGAAPDFGDLDGAFSQLEPLLREYAAAYEAATGYYGGKNYLDDAFARAEGYHNAIVRNWDELSARTDAFLRAFYAFSDELDARLLNYYADAGYPLRYAALRALSAAERTADYLDAVRVPDTVFAELRAAFNADADAWLSLDAEITEPRESLGDTESFNSALAVFGSAISGEPGAATVREAADALIDAYNEMVAG